MLEKAGEAFAAINACLAALYKKNVFIPAERAVLIAEKGCDVCAAWDGSRRRR